MTAHGRPARARERSDARPGDGLGPSTGSGQAMDAVAAPAPRRWPGVLAVVVAVLAAYTLVVLIGVRQDAREERILGSLTPVFEWLRDNGGADPDLAAAAPQDRRPDRQRHPARHRRAPPSRARGRRAAPVGCCSSSRSASPAGRQVALQSDDTTPGHRGSISPRVAVRDRARHLVPVAPPADVPALPARRRAARAARLAAGRWECVLVLALTLAALLSRTWALTELYDFFDLETIDWIVQGRTWSGYLGYLDYGFVQNNGGAIQLLPTADHLPPLRHLDLHPAHDLGAVGRSPRVPLMYTLGRRLGGVTAGVFASIFLITAPEQLFWSRNENLHFAPMAVLRAGHRPPGAVDGASASRCSPCSSTRCGCRGAAGSTPPAWWRS